jgi:SRR1
MKASITSIAAPCYDEDEGVEPSFTYVGRVNKQKRKNRKGRQNGEILDPSNEAVLQRRIEYIQKRKAEIQEDLQFSEWLKDALPLSSIENKTGSPPCKSALALGLGSVKDARPAQVQLAFFLLLCEHLGVQHMQAFDPICGEEDFSLLDSFNIVSLKENKQGRHTLEDSTFVFMPHCTSTLYENFLKANWSPVGLKRVLLCCNNLERYVSDHSNQQAKHQSEGEQPQSYIDRCIDYLVIREVPNLNSGQLSNSLNDLALQTFAPISSFLPQPQEAETVSKNPPSKLFPDQCNNFWTVIENTDTAAQLDPELI